jgi:hypothetical protein
MKSKLFPLILGGMCVMREGTEVTLEEKAITGQANNYKGDSKDAADLEGTGMWKAQNTCSNLDIKSRLGGTWACSLKMKGEAAENVREIW